jgi:hypothetical protein
MEPAKATQVLEAGVQYYALESMNGICMEVLT